MRQDRALLLGVTFGAIVFCNGSALAQTSPTQPAPFATAPQSYPAVGVAPSAPSAVPPPTFEQASPPPVQPASSLECIPACRPSFICAQGKCVSACNPPCGPNESCAPDGQCVIQTVAPAAAPFSAPIAVAPTQPGQTTATQPVSNAAASSSHFHEHKGFYLRIGLGAGALLPGSDVAGHTSSFKLDLSGFAEQFEFALGGSPMPGLVIGGGIFSTVVGSPSASVKGYSDSVSAGTLALSTIGPMVDIYPNPHLGLHLQGAFGPTVMNFSNGDLKSICAGSTCDYYAIPATTYAGAGWGGVLGFGFEGWVGNRWSMGGLLRLQYASATLVPTDSTFERIDTNTLALGLLLTVTYN